MPLILCIETATAACSVALVKDNKPIAGKQSNKKNAHSTVLNVFIEELFTTSAFSYSDLKAVAVSKGPGSYTGLRIGISSAKGLCYALDIPVIALETLLCMASGFLLENSGLAENALLCPMIDARRMEVFAGVYDMNLHPLAPVEALIVDKNAFQNLQPTRPVYYFGDGAEKCTKTFSQRPNWHFLPGFINSAAHMTQLATEYFNISRFENLAYFEPFYLKDFIAGKPNVKGLRP